MRNWELAYALEEYSKYKSDGFILFTFKKTMRNNSFVFLPLLFLRDLSLHHKLRKAFL